jgi:hypothetical protein
MALLVSSPRLLLLINSLPTLRLRFSCPNKIAAFSSHTTNENKLRCSRARPVLSGEFCLVDYSILSGDALEERRSESGRILSTLRQQCSDISNSGAVRCCSLKSRIGDLSVQTP